jgi:RNA polymerase sigma-70 factor, ECF subfamily
MDPLRPAADKPTDPTAIDLRGTDSITNYSPRSGGLTRSAPATPSANEAGIQELRVLYDLHGAEIFRFCNRLLGDVGSAEEAVQETFLRAWRSSHSWDPTIAAKRTWMYAIARNACLDVLRARQRRIPLESWPVSGGNDHWQNPSDRNPFPVENGNDDPAFESVMANWMLEEALRRIGSDHREAIVRTYVNDRPYPEVAAELGIPETTLRTRVFYGLRALRKVLEEMGWHE